jgi:nitrite reductase (NADH) small subunit
VLVISFVPEQYNYVLVGDEPYFIFRLSDGARIMFNGCCLHRGGPLHLGRWDNDRNCLICPWHQTRYPEKTLRSRAVPLICSEGKATAVLDTPPHTSLQFFKKRILPSTDADHRESGHNPACGNQ